MSYYRNIKMHQTQRSLSYPVYQGLNTLSYMFMSFYSISVNCMGKLVTHCFETIQDVIMPDAL